MSRLRALSRLLAASFALVTVAVAVPAAADTAVPTVPSARVASPPAPTYYKLVRQVPMRKEAPLRPAMVADRMADPHIGAGRPGFRNTNAFTERLLESARRQAAPNLPSRAESAFITPASSVAYWRTQLPSSQTLVEARPADPSRVTTRDIAHLDRTISLVRRAFAPPQPGTAAHATPERAALLRQAHQAAVDYWTKEPTKGAHVEVLAGGGAVYVRRAEHDPSPQ